MMEFPRMEDELLSPMILLVKALKIEKLLQSHSPHKGITA